MKKAEYIDYKVVYLENNDWIDVLKKSQPISFFLTNPPNLSSSQKQNYDERLMILDEAFDIPIFPTLKEVLLYENKRYLASWLSVNNIPHPTTRIFYSKKEAVKFALSATYPQVAKTNIGASGSGVYILRSKNEAKKYILETYSGKGATRRSGPNLKKGGLLKRGLKYFTRPKDLIKKLAIYKTVRKERQTEFILLQEFIPHKFEWRVVRIGDSYFAHQKLLRKGKASGSLLKRYKNPPLDLLDFVKDITENHKLYSQAIDIFETDNGYLVNEMQCIFGQSDPYQMLIDGIQGRYRLLGGEWTFEAGDFTSNQCFDLRISYIVDSVMKLNEKNNPNAK